MNLKKIIYDLLYCFANYFVAYIPCWWVRKLLYLIMGMKIGKNSRINMKVTVYSPWKICIGQSTMINEFAVLDGRGGLQIGNNCSISFRSVIYSAGHYVDSSSFEGFKKRTLIDDGSWICVNSVILPGAHVRENCVIGANSVFHGETKPNHVYGRATAEPIRKRKVTEVKMKNITYFR